MSNLCKCFPPYYASRIAGWADSVTFCTSDPISGIPVSDYPVDPSVRVPGRPFCQEPAPRRCTLLCPHQATQGQPLLPHCRSSLLRLSPLPPHLPGAPECTTQRRLAHIILIFRKTLRMLINACMLFYFPLLSQCFSQEKSLERGHF